MTTTERLTCRHVGSARRIASTTRCPMIPFIVAVIAVAVGGIVAPYAAAPEVNSADIVLAGCFVALLAAGYRLIPRRPGSSDR